MVARTPTLPQPTITKRLGDARRRFSSFIAVSCHRLIPPLRDRPSACSPGRFIPHPVLGQPGRLPGGQPALPPLHALQRPASGIAPRLLRGKVSVQTL